MSKEPIQEPPGSCTATQLGPDSSPRRARVAYITSPSLRKAADRLPSNPGRSTAVHSLIESLGLLHDAQSSAGASPSLHSIGPTAKVVQAVPASKKDLTRYHDSGYVEALLNDETAVSSDQPPAKRRRFGSPIVNDAEGDLEPDSHGLEYDCPAFLGLREYCLEIAGGSFTAARELREGRADIAIHWDGGRHHATKDKAAGFCYINDIVLAILELQRAPLPRRTPVDGATPPPRRLKKILYIDLDLHHGDGVAEAFENNPNVTTVSVHLWSPGFYPSTSKGHLNYSGPTSSSASAAFTALNLAIPHSGLGDTNFFRLVKSCIKPIFSAMQPDALVFQCGLDGLAGDPCKEFNISLRGYGAVIFEILGWRSATAVPVPVLMLGGGGYNTPNAARGWAYATSLALGRPLELDVETVPEACEMWEKLVGRAEQGESLDVPASSGRRDENTEGDLLEIEGVFARYADEIAKRANSKR